MNFNKQAKIIVTCGTMLVLWLGQAASGAQESRGTQEFDPNTTRLTLGSASGSPGTSVVVPIYFTPAAGVEMNRLKVVVNFVSANLKFSKIERGYTTEAAEVDLSTEIRAGKSEEGVETSTLTIIALLSSAERPEKGIPAGLLAYLAMKIDEAGQPGTITLRGSFEAVELRSNRPIQDLRPFSATVKVLAPGLEPLISCFLFSH